MSNNKESSVEYYIDKLGNILGDEICNKLTIEQTNKIHFLVKHAKAMHKEEMKNFTEDWYHNGPLLGVDVLVSTSIEKHYNETFGGNNEQQ